MSHFYNRKAYTFAETDEMMLELKKEMSNFLTKEEAELIMNRRYAIVDPGPYRINEEISKLHMEIDQLRQEVYFLRQYIHKFQKEIQSDEPTI